MPAHGRAFNTWGIVFGIGLGFGPIIGAAIVVLSSWEWVFLMHAPIAVLALVLVIAGVDESRDPQRRRNRVIRVDENVYIKSFSDEAKIQLLHCHHNSGHVFYF